MSALKKYFPPQIKYIIGNEACERFSYYGMRGILVIFMVKYLAASESNAKAIFHAFAGASYFCALIGGYVADRYLGKYRTILAFSWLYCLGHGLLAFWGSRSGLFAGLVLIALGTGGVKSCISAYVGDQFTRENKDLVTKVFDIFYWTINFGSFFSSILIPWVLARFGPHWAFGIPGILMAVSTLIFWLGRGRYRNPVIPEKTRRAGFLPVFFYALSRSRHRTEGKDFFDAARVKYTHQEVEEARIVAGIIKVFSMVTIHAGLYDQSSSSWVLQADRMNLKVWGVQLYASQIHAANPILIMLLIPLFSIWVYPAIERLGIKATPLRKMGMGMFLAAPAFISVGIIQMAIDGGSHPSVAWQLIPYFIMAVSEIMISISGLDFAYSQAPRSKKSTIMSFFFLTVFVGNSLTAIISKINFFNGASYFFFFAGLMALASMAFAWIAQRFQVREIFESEMFPVSGQAVAETASS